MKKIFKYILAAASLSGLAACSYLDRAPYTQTSPENFFQNEAQFKLALTGAYEAMNTDKVGGVTVGGGTYLSGLSYLMSGPSDEVVTKQNAADSYGVCTDFLRSSFTQSTPGLRRFWIAFYAGIDRANSIIEHIDNLGNNANSKYYLAEARFLRGFYYWNLAQNFGGIPIVKYHSDGQEPRSCLKEVYRYILDDLEAAYDFLPETGGILGNASANKYTAAAYRAKIYNYLAACKRNNVGADILDEQKLNDFSWVNADSLSLQAVNMCSDIITNSQYTLIEDWTNLFRETTKDDQHKECLFMAENYLSGAEGVYPTSQVFGFTAGCTASTADFTGPTVWSGYVIPTVMVFEMYSPKDPRRDWFMGCKQAKSEERAANPSLKLIEETRDKYKYSRPFYRPTSWSSDSGHDSDRQTFLPWLNGDTNMQVNKFRFAEYGQIPEHTSGVHSLSIPLMRLADVYLMYAEAIYFAEGDEAKAREQFRKVLARACKLHWTIDSPEITFAEESELVDELMAAYHKDDFVDELLETRERELCYEGSRKYDLIRFGRIDERIKLLTEGSPDGNPSDHPYTKYFRRFDGAIRSYNSSGSTTGIEALRQGWVPYKIWLPISDLERAANPNLTQNVNW